MEHLRQLRKSPNNKDALFWMTPKEAEASKRRLQQLNAKVREMKTKVDILRLRWSTLTGTGAGSLLFKRSTFNPMDQSVVGGPGAMFSKTEPLQQQSKAVTAGFFTGLLKLSGQADPAALKITARDALSAKLLAVSAFKQSATTQKTGGIFMNTHTGVVAVEKPKYKKPTVSVQQMNFIEGGGCGVSEQRTSPRGDLSSTAIFCSTLTDTTKIVSTNRAGVRNSTIGKRNTVYIKLSESMRLGKAGDAPKVAPKTNLSGDKAGTENVLEAQNDLSLNSTSIFGNSPTVTSHRSPGKSKNRQWNRVRDAIDISTVDSPEEKHNIGVQESMSIGGMKLNTVHTNSNDNIHVDEKSSDIRDSEQTITSDERASTPVDVEESVPGPPRFPYVPPESPSFSLW